MVKIIKMIPQLGEKAIVARFAELTGKSHSAIVEFKNRGILEEDGNLLEWLHAYMKHLPNMAGGRGSDNDELTAAKISELEAKTALNRLTYHERLGTLINIDVASATLLEWASFNQRETDKGFNQIIHEVEHKYNITIDPALKAKISGAITQRIKNYAEQLAQEGFTPSQ